MYLNTDMERSRQSSVTSIDKTSRAGNQSGAASEGDSDSPSRTHVSEGRASEGSERDIRDINPRPSSFVPASPAAELGTGQSKFNGGGTGAICGLGPKQDQKH